MGIFKFFKKSGKKVIEEPKESATTAEQLTVDKEAQIEQLVASLRMMNFHVNNLNIDLDGDQITVTGEAENQETREKVVLAVGNIEGIACVDDQMTVDQQTPEARFYEVKSGDSLSKIAAEMYGDAMKYPVIFEANKPMLDDPDKIYPGQMLRIPEL